MVFPGILLFTPSNMLFIPCRTVVVQHEILIPNVEVQGRSLEELAHIYNQLYSVSAFKQQGCIVARRMATSRRKFFPERHEGLWRRFLPALEQKMVSTCLRITGTME